MMEIHKTCIINVDINYNLILCGPKK